MKNLKSNRFCKTIACALMAVLFEIATAVPIISAQSYGSLDGVVTDSSGGVANLTVTITDQSTGAKRTTLTSAKGNYTFPIVNPAVYVVSIGNGALAKVVQVFIGQTATVEFVIPAGIDIRNPTTGQVQVPTGISQIQQYDSIPVDIRSANIGKNFTNKEIERSPGNGQQITPFLLQVPGAVDANSGPLGGVTFNGQPGTQNVLLVDGVDFTPLFNFSQDPEQNINASSTQNQLSLFNIREFRVDSNNYSASLGTGTGAQIRVITKRGENLVQYKVYYYPRSSVLNARNFFDFESKPSLSFNRFGGEISGPIFKDKLLYYIGYDGIQARLGSNAYEAVPSASARARAVASARPLIASFINPDATILPGASTNPDFDIVKLASATKSRKNIFTGRLDFNRNENSTFQFQYTHAIGNDKLPEGVTGRRQIVDEFMGNGFASWKASLSPNLVSEAKFAINAAYSRFAGRGPSSSTVDLSEAAISIGGSAPYSGTPNLPGPIGIATAGGLMRQNPASSGRNFAFEPTVYLITDNMKLTKGNHEVTFGGEIRFIRLSLKRLNGTTYSFASLSDLLQNKLQSAQFTGDLGMPSPLNNEAGTTRKARQEYYIGYAQDKWKARNNLTIEYGLRYEYYSVLREAENRAAIFDIDSGTFLPPGTPFYRSPKNNFLPRIGVAWALNHGANNPMVLRASYGIYSGAKRLQDQIQPIENDRISFTQIGGAFPVAKESLIAGFFNNPDTRSFQPSAFSRDYNIADRAYKYDVSLEKILAKDSARLFKLTATYAGSQSRNLLLQNFANRITSVQTNPDPSRNAIVIREFDIVRGSAVLTPFAEIDFRSSDGRSSYDSLQISADGQWIKPLAAWGALPLIKTAYTLSRNYGTVNSADKAVTTGNPFDFDYDRGYNADDVRNAFSLSVQYVPPFGKDGKYLNNLNKIGQALLGNWVISTLFNARSGLPIDVRLTRPDVVYLDASNRVFSSPAQGRRAVINTPGGGASRNARRPDLIAGVNPYLGNDRIYLNPAAFAIPAPATFGNLKRGELRGPGLKQFDLSLSKTFSKEVHSVDFRVDFFNLFNTANFGNPLARLPNVLGTDSALNQLQPGAPFTAQAVGTFGLLNRTIGLKDGFGLINSSRQIHFSLTFSRKRI